jgi:hypothetical protein
MELEVDLPFLTESFLLAAGRELAPNLAAFEFSAW